MGKKLLTRNYDREDFITLFNRNVNNYIPKKIDFEQVAEIYTKALRDIVNQKHINLFGLEGKLAFAVRKQVYPDYTSDTAAEVIFRWLIASICLKLNEFSKILLEYCNDFATNQELKYAIGRVTSFSDKFEWYRQECTNQLEKNSKTLNKVTSKNNSGNANVQQEIPKYWILMEWDAGAKTAIVIKYPYGFEVCSDNFDYINRHGVKNILLFDSLQQAQNFINNLKQNESYFSTNKVVNYASYEIIDISSNKYIKAFCSINLQDYIKVMTPCGEAYMHKNSPYLMNN